MLSGDGWNPPRSRSFDPDHQDRRREGRGSAQTQQHCVHAREHQVRPASSCLPPTVEEVQVDFLSQETFHVQRLKGMVERIGTVICFVEQTGIQLCT